MNANELERSLSELSADVPLEESQAAAEARRRRVVSQMQRVNVGLVRESQKVRWLRWGVGGGLVAGAAAAVALFAVGPLASSMDASGADQKVSVGQGPYVPLRTEMTKGSVTRLTGKDQSRLGLGDSLLLEEANVLETQEDSHARVHGGRGLDIDVGPGSRVVVGAVEPKSGAARIKLQKGQVHCSVDPAGEGPKLSVITPDATVEVKGTIFSVEVTEDHGASRSCVRVQRGWVTVHRKGAVEQVHAGESSGCAPSKAVEDDEPAVALDEVPEVTPPFPEKRASAPESRPEPAFPSLAEQNSLLARALASERRGELAVAESQLTELLERFPGTPLRVDAEAARSRIRKRSAETRP